ncbi:MAG: hypothetical protein JXB47_16720 [Anaerolineae bacterium]|nr:hypothetical protein [Anaerolineae bacterium]
MALTGQIYDLREACSGPGCPVCVLVNREVERYFDRLLYSQVVDIDARAGIRSAWGYCNRHAYMLLRDPGGAVGIAVIYEDVMKNLVRALDAAEWQTGRFTRKGATRLVEKLAPKQECPACAHQAQEEYFYMKALIQGLEEGSLVEPLAQSRGLCLRHLRLALDGSRDRAVFETLVRIQRKIWQELGAQLTEFIRKNDHRFQHEPMGPEGDSWSRVVRQVSGEPGARVGG